MIKCCISHKHYYFAIIQNRKLDTSSNDVSCTAKAHDCLFPKSIFDLAFELLQSCIVLDTDIRGLHAGKQILFVGVGVCHLRSLLGPPSLKVDKVSLGRPRTDAIESQPLVRIHG